VRFLNPIDLAGGTRVFVVADGSASTDVELAGKLSNGSVTKSGTGTMLISANNNYTGTTTISAGTLVVGGTLTSGGGVFVNAPGTLAVTGRVTSAVTVDGMLAGTGTLTGGVTVNSGGILSPGMGDAGVLNVGTLSLADNFVYNWQVSATTTDQVEVATAGGLAFTTGNAWTLNLEVAPLLWQGISHTNDTFVLFNVASAGAPIGLTNALFGGSWNTDYAQVQVLGNQVVLTGIYQPLMLAIPEPNVLVLWLSSIATIYAARRRQRRKRL
jgi:autotransporter-associated beta strand protein